VREKIEEKTEEEGDISDVEGPWEGFSHAQLEKVEKVLRWKEVGPLPGKARYLGGSERNQRRKKAEERERQETAKSCLKISQMWATSTSHPLSQESSPQPSPPADQKMTLEEAVERLEEITKRQARDLLSNYQFSRFLSLRLYFTYLRQGAGKMDASLKVSQDFGLGMQG